MNCQKIKNWILLDETGELDAWRRRRLTNHLHTCADCREFMRHTQTIRQNNPPVTDMPASRIMANINNAIRTGVPERPGAIRIVWRRHPRILRAAAAAMALLAGAWLMTRAPTPGPDGAPELAAAMDDSPLTDLLLTENVVEIRRLEEFAGTATALEMELMLVEGLAI